MKKQTRFLLIGLVSMIVVSILAIIVINATTVDDPETLLFGEEIELKSEVPIEDFPGGSSFSYIASKAVAYDASDKKIGDVYTVKIRNGYTLDAEDAYGTIELLVGIDTDDLVYASVVKLNQSTWTVLGIKAYIEETFNGIPYEDVELIPEFDAAAPSAGATAHDSTDTIKQAVLNVVNHHYDIITDLTPIRLERYQEALPNTASFTELDLSTDPESIVVKAALYDSSDVLLGYAIEASATNDFGLLHVAVVINTNGDIVGAIFVDYGNSYFKTEITSAIGDLVGLSITDDLTSGFALAAPSSPATVPTMNALMTDVKAAYDHISNGGA